ncbi:hypothetical protein Tsubulata_010971 [Turnera subulata]|uniref:Uncharacterized protein n=1 Tax=Turnera subulata TaxID=218843 RepID=A0A9Q0GDD7_9ROSI|nr:hypothetical protein Tsubulata_010971 [Turnera subulata]
MGRTRTRTRCTHCGEEGHNWSTCKKKLGIRLFGVQCIQGCQSTPNNPRSRSRSSSSTSPPNSSLPRSDTSTTCNSVLEIDFAAAASSSSPPSRKTRAAANPWTKEEHKQFLSGLEKYGKGNWRDIARNCVPSRTSTQVASHAQKHFVRQEQIASNTRPTPKRRRRQSIFDSSINITSTASPDSPSPASSEEDNNSRSLVIYVDPNSPSSPPPPPKEEALRGASPLTTPLNANANIIGRELVDLSMNFTNSNSNCTTQFFMNPSSMNISNSNSSSSVVVVEPSSMDIIPPPSNPNSSSRRDFVNPAAVTNSSNSSDPSSMNIIIPSNSNGSTREAVEAAPMIPSTTSNSGFHHYPMMMMMMMHPSISTPYFPQNNIGYYAGAGTSPLVVDGYPVPLAVYQPGPGLSHPLITITITVDRAPPPASPARAALPSPSFSSRRRRSAARGAVVCNRVTGATRDDPPTTPPPRFTSSLARDGPPCLPPRARCTPRPSPSRRRRPATQVSSRLKTTPSRSFRQPGRGRAGLTRRVPGLGSNRIAHSDLGFPLVTITVDRAPPPASPARAALPSPSFSSRRRRSAARGAVVCNRVTGATRDDPPTTPPPRFTSSLARDGPPCLPPRARCTPRPSPSRRCRPATQVSSRLKTTPPRPFQQPGRGRAGLTRRVPGLGSNLIAHSDLGFLLGFGL